MEEFLFQEMFPALGDDKTEYRCLGREAVSTAVFEGQDVIKISSDGLVTLAETAFKDVAHLYRASHLQKLKTIFDDAESSENDKYVSLEMLKNPQSRFDLSTRYFPCVIPAPYSARSPDH